MRRDCEEIAEGWRKKGVELLLGENFEERRLLLVEGAPEGCDKLHCRGLDGLRITIDSDK